MTPAERRFQVQAITAHVQAITTGMPEHEEYLKEVENWADWLLRVVDIKAASAPTNAPVWFPEIIPNFDLLILKGNHQCESHTPALHAGECDTPNDDADGFRMILAKTLDVLIRERTKLELPADNVIFTSAEGSIYIGFPSTLRTSMMSHFGMDQEDTVELYNALA